MTHLREEDLILHYYGEASGEVREHLADCESCRDVSNDVTSFLSGIPVEEIPEPPGEWEDAVWSRLDWRLRQKKERSWRPLLAIAAVIVVAFVAGLLTRDFMTSPEPIDSAGDVAELTSDEAGRNRVFLLVLSDHLDRSERVLLELTHEGESPSGERQSRAEDLLSRNRLYRLTAEQTGNPRLASLLEELEPVLVEIARSSNDEQEESLESIRKRVEDRELIFKIRVLGQQVRQDASPAVATDVSI